MPDNAEPRDDLDQAYTIPGASYEDVVSWYEAQLPVEDRYKDLAFCETQELDNITTWLWWDDAEKYSDDDLRPWLSVTVLDQHPTEVVVSYDPEDASGPCD
ncbi:hypothetical protein M3148_16090 [Georgenia satyanarayanai]|uniref:hypothetical protein n=1 Tax=Georgenia satyanarayanai TaxID=860221 RepID=UPI00203BA47E|nr:hypothetical protein [Georgenia satyanarayanai]MCM3662498.1 hypothetical protein [Georgenia satyanarayanai]